VLRTTLDLSISMGMQNETGCDVDCTMMNPCQMCDDETGSCIADTNQNGLEVCDDNNDNTVGDYCENGQCVGTDICEGKCQSPCMKQCVPGEGSRSGSWSCLPTLNDSASCDPCYECVSVNLTRAECGLNVALDEVYCFLR